MVVNQNRTKTQAQKILHQASIGTNTINNTNLSLLGDIIITKLFRNDSIAISKLKLHNYWNLQSDIERDTICIRQVAKIWRLRKYRNWRVHWTLYEHSQRFDKIVSIKLKFALSIYDNDSCSGEELDSDNMDRHSTSMDASSLADSEISNINRTV